MAHLFEVSGDEKRDRLLVEAITFGNVQNGLKTRERLSAFNTQNSWGSD